MGANLVFPDLYTYDDYRRYLADWAGAKGQSRHFSMRWFARKAGFRAHNILQVIMQGKRNLSMESIRKFAAALELDEAAAAYFHDLVGMNQAKDAKERLHYYQRLIKHPGRRSVKPLEESQLSFFRHWLAPVIFEMTQFADFKAEPEWIAEQFGDVSADEVQRVLDDLLRCGVIAEDETGRWRAVQEQIASGDDVVNMHLQAYHERSLEKAADALHVLPAAKRHFHVLTAAIPDELLPRLVELSEKFEAEVWRIIEAHPAPRDQVVQIGLHIFPSLRLKGVRPLRKSRAKGKGTS
jgi:uncharacterized protein (TIGR02147 family)